MIVGKGFLLTASLFCILLSSSESVEWQILREGNFSSAIHLHPRLLLMVTVPWSGESRSLMKELAHAVSCQQEKFGMLKLMLLYRSDERVLADALGALEGITFLYYHHSVSYKYQGRLRAQNILSSIYYLMPQVPEELPLIPLRTPEDIYTFIESTEKAVILHEFCGWTDGLLVKGKTNGTDQGGSFGIDFSSGAHNVLRSRWNEEKKGTENTKLSCAVENWFSRMQLLGGLSSEIASASSMELESKVGVGSSCTSEEFQQFESFLPKFINVAREFSLPPERIKFGLVSEKSLLSFLGVETSASVMTILYVSGCPGCSKILKEGDDLKAFLQTHGSPVEELEEGHELEVVLPASKLSLLLFVDRSSEMLETRTRSKEALFAFRKLALNHQNSYTMTGHHREVQRSSHQPSRVTRTTSRHPRLNLFPSSRNLRAEEKMSITITNQGKHINLDSSDLQGSSLQEILVHLLQQKEEKMFSTLAKEAGFHLLSDDFNIKEENLFHSGREPHSDKPEPIKVVFANTGDNKNGVDSPNTESTYDYRREEKLNPTNPQLYSQYSTVKETYNHPSSRLMSIEADKLYKNHKSHIGNDMKVEEKNPELPKLQGKQLYFQGFKGSFIFSDGDYRLLELLTSSTRMPSMVIVDPISQMHYAFPEDNVLNYSSMVDFLNGFLNGTVLPYRRSERVPVSCRGATHPPFVNLDFHEADSIPRVTARTFYDLVLGNSKSGNENSNNAWKRDVLVLFSNNWCGFCQRMELVVREVHRAVKGYTDILKVKSVDEAKKNGCDDVKMDKTKLPLIYLMDCTLNECSAILKSMGQREVYPTLLLFPAERKSAVPFDGDMAVSDVIKFIAYHGRNTRDLITEKGILRPKSQDPDYRNQNQNLFHNGSSITMGRYHEDLMKIRSPSKGALKHKESRPENSREAVTRVVPGSILVATERLLGTPPFDNSKILIVAADRSAGFEGLIFNKFLNWDSLDKLEGMEELKQAPLSFGGPLVKDGMPLVALARRFVDARLAEVFPGVYFLDQFDTGKEIGRIKAGNQSVADMWFFLGYSRWGHSQLYEEIAGGAWSVPADLAGQFEWPLE